MHTEDLSHHGRDFAICLERHFLTCHPRSQGYMEKFIGLEMVRNSAIAWSDGIGRYRSFAL